MSYELIRHQWVAAPIDQVFDFFSRADNLTRITPPWLGFEIRSSLPLEMHEGLIIDYRIRLGPIPLRWRSRIVEWSVGRSFVDVQERGPYKTWHHRHTFRPVAGGTLVVDVVRYDLRFGWIGRWAHRTFVRPSLGAIFDFRFAAIEARFPSPEPASSADRSSTPEPTRR